MLCHKAPKRKISHLQNIYFFIIIKSIYSYTSINFKCQNHGKSPIALLHDAIEFAL